MNRREFIHRTAYSAGAAWLHSAVFARRAFAFPSLSRKFNAADTVTLGKTGIQTSRLAMGTGTVGVGHHSHQTALGIKGLSDLLLNGYDHGLRFFDSADSYGSHPHVAEALKHVPRDKVTVLTKTWARDPASARADVDRFRREIGTDQIDICLMHCLTEGDWTERYKGVMDVLSEAKQKGIIRAHGCSCHSIEALRGALSVGRSRSRSTQSHRLTHGRRSRHRRQCSPRNARRRKGDRRHEDPWPGRPEQSPG